MSSKIKVLAVMLSVGLTACAGPAMDARSDVTSRQCFSASSVRGFTPVDGNTVHLKVSRGDIYELKLLTFCPDIDWSHSIGLRSRSGSSMICTQDAMNVEIVVLDRGVSIGPDSCRIRSIRKLDPEEVEAQEAARKAARSKPDA